MSEWSLNNSTGTTDMGLWADPVPGQQDSEAPSSPTVPKMTTGQSIPKHVYPLNIDSDLTDSNGEIVQECIQFTAVKQGGISLQKKDDDIQAQKIFEDQQKNVGASRKSDKFSPGMTITGSSGGYDARAEQKAAAEAQKAQEKGEKTTPTEEGESKTLVAKGLEATKQFLSDQWERITTPAKELEHAFLYMPSSVTFAEGAAWGAEGLGALGNLGLEFIKKGKGGSITDIMNNFTGGAITEVGKAAAIGMAAKAAGAAGAIGAAALIPGIGAGLKAAGRFAENPYEEQLFNGIGFREFSFEFAFAPSNEAEGNEVLNIIKMFRKNSRPGFVGGFMGEGLYTFPNEFKIQFLMNQKGALVQNKFLPKIHNCVCTNVSTNYTPEGFWVAMRDGRPVSYNLSLSFTETQKITQSAQTSESGAKGVGGVEEGY